MILALCMALTIVSVPAGAAQGSYTVTFDANGGTLSGTQASITRKFTVGRAYGSLPTPVWNDYIFTGWFDGYGGEVTSTTVFAAADDSTVLYAGWEPQYTVTFDANGGTLTGSGTIKTGEDHTLLSQPSNPTRTGWAFAGWYTRRSGGEKIEADTKFYGDTVVYAQWKAGYTITFHANGGKFIPQGTETVETWTDGILTVQPFTPVLDGYLFEGWFTEPSGGVRVPSGTLFSKNTTIYAHWRPEFSTEPSDEEYTVTFDPKGGRLMDEDAGTAMTVGGRLSALPQLYARTGWTFEGWYTAAGTRVTTDTVFTGDAEVSAHWSESVYTITFDPGGGKLSGWISSMQTGKDYTLPGLPDAPERDGYEFTGWYTAASGGSQIVAGETEFNANTTVYAHWTANAYAVTVNPNGGRLTGGSTIVPTKGGTLSEWPPAPVREGHTFIGWYTAASGGIEVTRSTVFTARATIYAHWLKDGAEGKPAEYDITFDPSGGLPSARVVIKTGADGRLPYLPNDPVRYGYEFEGWYTAASGGMKVEAGTVFDARATVYARWSDTAYTVTFDPNGGTLPNGGNTAVTNKDGKVSTTPFDPSREGYFFNGWYTAPSGGALVTPETVFVSDITIYAHWTTRTSAGTGDAYIVQFDPNGGTLTGGHSPMTTGADGKLLWLPSAANGSYSFSGWYNGSEKISTDTVFSEDTTVYASWTSTGGSSGASSKGYEIYTPGFISGGAIEISPDGKVKQGETVTVNITSGSGYQLAAFNVTGDGGRTISTSKKSSSQYTFVMPGANVTVTPVFSQAGGQTAQTAAGFSDVAPGAFYYNAVQWAARSGIAGSSGRSDTFVPSAGATRGEVVSFMWKAAGAPASRGTNAPFTDVPAGSPYYDAVMWARENDITNGYTSTTFAPDRVVTRGEAVTFLHRSAGAPRVSGGSTFKDVAKGAYYADAVNWAVSRGITNGKGSLNTFAPNDTVTRGEMVTFLYRAQS